MIYNIWPWSILRVLGFHVYEPFSSERWEFKKRVHAVKWCHDTQNNDTQNNDTQNNDTQNNDTQQNGLIYDMTHSINDTHHNNILPLCWASLSRVSRFICCYVECHYAKCRYADADCRYDRCRGCIKNYVLSARIILLESAWAVWINCLNIITKYGHTYDIHICIHV